VVTQRKAQKRSGVQEIPPGQTRRRGTHKEQTTLVRLARLMTLIGPDLDGYIKRVRSIRLLTREEEQILATLVQQGTASGASERDKLAGQEAKLRLIFHSLRFALWSALVSMSKHPPPRKLAVKAKVEPKRAGDDADDTDEGEGADGEKQRAEELERRLRRSSRLTALSRFARDRLPLADRIQEANIGLLDSIENFRPGREAKFITYAAYAISQRIAKAVLLERYRYGDDPAGGKVNLLSAEGMARVQAIAIKLRRLTGHEPSYEMIASDAEVGTMAVEKRFEEAMACPRYTLEALYSQMDLTDPTTGEQMHPGDLVWEPGALNGYDHTVLGDGYDAINEVLKTLSEREAGVIRLRFGLVDNQQRSLDEVGSVYGVTRERIRQIETQVMSKLRHPSRADKLRDYLDPEEYWGWFGCGIRDRAVKRPALKVKNLQSHPELYLNVPALAAEAREQLNALVGIQKAREVEIARVEAERVRQEAEREAKAAERARLRAERAARNAREWIELQYEFDARNAEEQDELAHELDTARAEANQAAEEAAERRRAAAAARSRARRAFEAAEELFEAGMLEEAVA
jgi:RNA polymerase primary sigma factor